MSDNPYESPVTNPSPVPSTDSISRHLENLQYPLNLSFKIISLASQATVTDANGMTVLYTKQKMFKLREHVEIYTDKSKATLLAEIRANKVIDWSARYDSVDADGVPLGAVGRKGWRSIFRSHYEVFNPGEESPDFSIREENPVAKVFDGLLGGIPIVGMATGYLFHPKYLAARASGDAVMRLEKRPAMWEGKFSVERLGEVTAREELNLILSFLMMILLERKRG